MFGYKPNGEPQNLWSFVMKDSVLDLTTDVQGGRVSENFIIKLLVVYICGKSFMQISNNQ